MMVCRGKESDFENGTKSTWGRGGAPTDPVHISRNTLHWLNIATDFRVRLINVVHLNTVHLSILLLTCNVLLLLSTDEIIPTFLAFFFPSP